MISNYKYLKNHLPNVTDKISNDVINLDNIILRDIMVKYLTPNKYDDEHLAVRGGDSTYHLTYEFSFKGEIYQIVLLDKYKKSSWTTMDDWLYIDIFFTNLIDLKYIHHSMKYEIYQLPAQWFTIEDNLDAMCEYEMQKIRPLLRKQKIKKLLK